MKWLNQWREWWGDIQPDGRQFAGIKPKYIPRGVTYTPIEPLATLRRMELEILSDIHEKTRAWMGIEDEESREYLLAHIKALDTAFDIVQAERKRHEKNEIK
jgi:hypothetical protein